MTSYWIGWDLLCIKRVLRVRRSWDIDPSFYPYTSLFPGTFVVWSGVTSLLLGIFVPNEYVCVCLLFLFVLLLHVPQFILVLWPWWVSYLPRVPPLSLRLWVTLDREIRFPLVWRTRSPVLRTDTVFLPLLWGFREGNDETMGPWGLIGWSSDPLREVYTIGNSRMSPHLFSRPYPLPLLDQVCC